MFYRKERPNCRKAINNLCKKMDLTLEELRDHPQIFLSKGLKVQLLKMIEEAKHKK